MTNYKEMLERAKSGRISQAEISTVAEELKNPRRQADPYTLLHILGKAEAKSYLGLVEQYLQFKEDPMLVRLALQILCNYWGYCSRYIGEVTKFVQGVPWDPDEEIRQSAISIAGECLRVNQDAKLLHELIQIYENDGESQTIREGAYLALARAVGRNWNELPSSARHFDLRTQTQPSVIETAKRRVAESA